MKIIGLWSHHFMANRWGNNGTSEKLYFLWFQNHCRCWLQPWNWKTLAPWKKSYDQPRQHVKKQRHYFADKGPYSLSNGFSSSHVWMWGLVAKLGPTLATPQTTLSVGFSRQEHWSVLPFPSPGDLPTQKCEGWTINKAVCVCVCVCVLASQSCLPLCRRIDAFELWWWRRLLRVPWTARRPNQSILKEISPGCSLEGLMLKLKLQYFGHLMQITDSLEKTHWRRCWARLGAGGEGAGRGWDGWMTSLTLWTWVWVNSGSLACCSPWGLQRVGHDWAIKVNW